MRTKIDFLNNCDPKSKNCFKKLFNVISGKPKLNLDFNQIIGFSCRASTSLGEVSMFWGFPSDIGQDFRVSSLEIQLHLLKEVGVSQNIIISYKNELLNLGFKEIGEQDIRNVRANACDIIQPPFFSKFIDILEKVRTQIHSSVEQIITTTSDDIVRVGDGGGGGEWEDIEDIKDRVGEILDDMDEEDIEDYKDDTDDESLRKKIEDYLEDRRSAVK